MSIKPKKLQETLLTIKEKLPESLKLPFNPRTQIWNYYRMVTSSAIFENNKILIILDIPLINRGTQFEVFKIYNMPVPNVAISKQFPKEEPLKNRHLVANYMLEAKALAINRQRTKFVIMTDEEAKLCSSPLVSFCKFISPIYPANKNTFCLVALFIGQEQRIKQLCQARVYVNKNLPNAEYMSDGLWLIATAERLTFTRTCQGPNSEPKTFYADPPLSLVRMRETCTATNNELTLQPFYKIRSEMSVGLDFKVVEEALSETSFKDIKLWEPVDNVIHKINLSYQYQSLPEIEEMKMDHLVNEINSLEEVRVKEKGFWQRYKYFIIGSIIVFVLIILALISLKFKKGYRFWIGICGKNVSESGTVDSPTETDGHYGRTDDQGQDEIGALRERLNNLRNYHDHGLEAAQGLKRKRPSVERLYDECQELKQLSSSDLHDSPFIPQPRKQPRRDLTDREPLRNLLP